MIVADPIEMSLNWHCVMFSSSLWICFLDNWIIRDFSMLMFYGKTIVFYCGTFFVQDNWILWRDVWIIVKIVGFIRRILYKKIVWCLFVTYLFLQSLTVDINGYFVIDKNWQISSRFYGVVLNWETILLKCFCW